MKNKKIFTSTLSVATFVFVFLFGGVLWADSYRSEHHYYYYGERHSPRFNPKPPRHHPPHHYKTPAPKYYPRIYEPCDPPRRDIRNKHVYKGGPQKPVYHRQHPAYYDRRHQYRPYSGSAFYFGTSIYEPGLSMAFSIRGR
jgi:hypothetical protein